MGSQCVGGSGRDQHYGPLGRFNVCKSMVHRGVDRYLGSECVGGGGGDQHYGPLGMFSVCKSMVHRGVDYYPRSECAGSNGVNPDPHPHRSKMIWSAGSERRLEGCNRGEYISLSRVENTKLGLIYARHWLSQSITLINTCRKVPLQVNFFR